MRSLLFSDLVLLVSLFVIVISALPASLQEVKKIPGSFRITVHRKPSPSAAAPGVLLATQQDVVSDDGPQWNTEVSVGGQQFKLLVDTGSADLWVFSTELPANETGSHSLYNRAGSSTSAVFAGEKFDINYSVPGASGYVATDVVAVGGATISRMPVGVATNVGDYYIGRQEDGLIGLAFKYGNSIRPDQQPTFMEILQSGLSLPEMTCNFRLGADGTMEFGAIDNTQYTGTLTTVPVNNQTDGSWTVDNFSFNVGGVSVTQSMLFDTGGVWMTVDPSIAKAYWAQVQGVTDSSGTGSNYAFPCSTSLPDFSFSVGGVTSIIPGSYFNGGLYIGTAPLCTGALQGGAGRGSVASPFFGSQFVVFNHADPSISFAPHA